MGLQHRPHHIRLGRRRGDLRELDVDGHPGVVERGRLQDNPGSAHHHRYCEDPQEQSVQHHGHIFPVLFHLQEWRLRIFL